VNNIEILDCTLRDGGYVNDWSFSFSGIKDIIANLGESGIDYAECGFFKPVKYDKEKSIFSSISQLKSILSDLKIGNTKFSLMINFGEYDINEIPDSTDSDIIFRVVFNKADKENALDYCNKLKEKGYKIFINPKSSNKYTNIELSELIKEVNRINPEGFTIVDTTSSMKEDEVVKIYTLTNKILNKNIKLCFHFHNSLQLAFANALSLIKISEDRPVIIDSTVLGIGRGGGNLCTEIITDYINQNSEKKFNITPLVKIADKYINPIFCKKHWGYSIPYFLSASNACHPNYAKYFIENNIPEEKMDDLFKKIPPEQKPCFNESVAKSVLNKYHQDIIPTVKS